MIRPAIVCSLGLLLFAASAHAGFFTNNNTNTNSPSSFTKATMPLWKQRLYDRFQNQWDRPGGVNFPKPTAAPAVVSTTAPQAKVEGTFWSRVTKALRALRNWNSGKITTKAQTTLENQSGFGDNVRRADDHMNMTWHFRRATRVKLPKPFKLRGGAQESSRKPPRSRFKPRTWD